MKPLMDIELSRQLYLPGEEISGRVVLKFPEAQKLTNLILTLHGEEATGAYNIILSVLTPVLKEELILYTQEDKQRPYVREGSYPFKFALPEDIPPSFSSGNFSCIYYLSCKINWGLGKDMIIKTHINIVPKPILLPKPQEVEFGRIEDGLKFMFYLEKDFAFVGQTLKGNYNLEYKEEDLPRRLAIKLLAEASSYGGGPRFKEIIWQVEKKFTLKPQKEPHIRGNFGIYLPNIVPFSGIWNTFMVDWKIHASLEFNSGKKMSCEAGFDVYKFYEKFWTVIKKDQLEEASVNE